MSEIPEDAGLAPGRRIRVLRGPLKGFCGVIAAIDSENQRPTVKLLIFGRTTLAECHTTILNRSIDKRIHNHQPKTPLMVLDEALGDTMRDVIKDLVIGAILGGILGLGAYIWTFTDPLFFPGDTMVAGAIVCGAFGCLFGERFFDWLLDVLHWG